MATAEFYECPGCGARVSPDMKKCEYCDKPVIIHSIGAIQTFTPIQLNKYASSYRKQLVADPDDRELNRSMGICYLKLKLYDKANEAFERAVTDNFEDADSYFYAAAGRLHGKKAFITPRPDIDKAIEYLNAANMIAPNPVNYLLLAYINIPQPGIPESFRVMLKELQSLGMDVVVQDKDGNEIDMRQNFDDEETGFDMRDVAGSETVTNENELLNDYTIKDADAGFDDPSVLDDDNSAPAESSSDEVNLDD